MNRHQRLILFPLGFISCEFFKDANEIQYKYAVSRKYKCCHDWRILLTLKSRNVNREDDDMPFSKI